MSLPQPDHQHGQIGRPPKDKQTQDTQKTLEDRVAALEAKVDKLMKKVKP